MTLLSASLRPGRACAPRLLAAPPAPALLLLAALGLAACDADSPLSTDIEPPPTALAFAAARLPVCHLTSSETNEYVPIEVAEPAFDVHIAHGDAAIGDPVPDMEGYVFGDACQPVAATCPCFDADDLALLDFGSNAPDFLDMLAEVEFRLTTLSTHSLSLGPVIGYDSGREVGLCTFDPIYSGSSSSAVIRDDLTRAETEACRVLIYDEAKDRGVTCVGDACGGSYVDLP
jgi:hypothetical protein